MCLSFFIHKRCYSAMGLGLAFIGMWSPIALGKEDYSVAKNVALEAAYIQSGYKAKVKQLEAAGRQKFGNQKFVAAAIYVGSLVVKKEVKVKTGPWRLDANPNQVSLTFTVGF